MYIIPVFSVEVFRVKGLLVWDRTGPSCKNTRSDHTTMQSNSPVQSSKNPQPHKNSIFYIQILFLPGVQHDFVQLGLSVSYILTLGELTTFCLKTQLVQTSGSTLANNCILFSIRQAYNTLCHRHSFLQRVLCEYTSVCVVVSIWVSVLQQRQHHHYLLHSILSSSREVGSWICVYTGVIYYVYIYPLREY